jgi:hypothetical protein
MPGWVNVVGIEALGMRQQGFGKLAPFHLIIRKGA